MNQYIMWAIWDDSWREKFITRLCLLRFLLRSASNQILIFPWKIMSYTCSIPLMIYCTGAGAHDIMRLGRKAVGNISLRNI